MLDGWWQCCVGYVPKVYDHSLMRPVKDSWSEADCKTYILHIGKASLSLRFCISDSDQ